MWTSEEIDGKTVELFWPTATPAIGGLLFLHDRDGATLRDQRDATTWLEGKPIAVACPRGGECWWTDRLWPPFDARRAAEAWLMHSLLPQLKTHWGDVPLAITGVGMGGHGSLRIAFRHFDVFPVVAALDAAIDCHELYYEGTSLDEIYSSPEQCRQDSPVLQVNPAQQPRRIFFACATGSRWERGNDRLHEKLTALGVEHRFATQVSETGVGAMLDFVAQAIVGESRRLL
jgi:S-formylglutathione hydrolase FrmB